MPINPDPFYLVRASKKAEPKTHDAYLESLSLEDSPGTANRGTLFVTDDLEIYKELGHLVSIRCYEQGRKFSFRYSDLTVYVEGEHLVRLYDLVNKGRLAVVREGAFDHGAIKVVISKVELLEKSDVDSKAANKPNGEPRAPRK